MTLETLMNPLSAFLGLGGLALVIGGTVALWPQKAIGRLLAPRFRPGKKMCSVTLVMGLLMLGMAGWTLLGNSQGRSVSASAQQQSEQAAAGPRGRARAGDPVPQFGLSLLDGSTLMPSDMAEKALVVNFWSPDCQPCREKLPDLQGVWESYRSKGVILVGVSMPGQEDAVKEIVSEHGITYPMAVNGLVPRKFGVTGVPETFVVGPDGNVASVHVGTVTADQLREELDALLDE